MELVKSSIDSPSGPDLALMQSKAKSQSPHFQDAKPESDNKAIFAINNLVDYLGL